MNITNIKRLALSVVAVFVFIFAYEWLFHSVCLHDAYVQTASLWRPEAEINKNMAWFVLGQVVFSILFCFIYTKGCENKGWLEGARYGFWIGLLLAGKTIIMYAVQPLPLRLIADWIIGETTEYVLAGVVLALIYGKKSKGN